MRRAAWTLVLVVGGCGGDNGDSGGSPTTDCKPASGSSGTSSSPTDAPQDDLLAPFLGRWESEVQIGSRENQMKLREGTDQYGRNLGEADIHFYLGDQLYLASFCLAGQLDGPSTVSPTPEDGESSSGTSDDDQVPDPVAPPTYSIRFECDEEKTGSEGPCGDIDFLMTCQVNQAAAFEQLLCSGSEEWAGFPFNWVRPVP